MIISDPDSGMTCQVISDPDPTCKVIPGKKFLIRTDLDPQHWIIVYGSKQLSGMKIPVKICSNLCALHSSN